MKGDALEIICTYCGKSNEFKRAHEPSPGIGADGRPAESPPRRTRNQAPVGAVGPFKDHADLETLLQEVRQDVQTNWLTLYPQVFIKQELTKASNWLKNNPTRQKKQIGRFLSAWLDRANLTRGFGEFKREQQNGVKIVGKVIE